MFPLLQLTTSLYHTVHAACTFYLKLLVRSSKGYDVINGETHCLCVCLQGCTSLTDVGLAAIGHMTSLTNVNLQDCRQITGAHMI